MTPYAYTLWPNDNFSAKGSDFTIEDPKLDINLKITDLTPLSVSEGGINYSEVRYDKEGNERKDGKYSIGAYQKKDDSTSSIDANAGADQTICAGAEVTLTASGGDSYSWSDGQTTRSITVNPSETTTYTVTVSDGNTSDTDQVTVTVNNVTANAGQDLIITEGDEITLAASGGDSYLWSNGETTESITVSPESTSTYTVTVTKGGCEDTDQVQVEVNIISGGTNSPIAESPSGGMEFQIYPNPADEILNVSILNNNQSIDIQLIDINGKVILQDIILSSEKNTEKQLNTNIVTKGIYFIRLFNNEENVIRKIVVI